MSQFSRLALVKWSFSCRIRSYVQLSKVTAVLVQWIYKQNYLSLIRRLPLVPTFTSNMELKKLHCNDCIFTIVFHVTRFTKRVLTHIQFYEFGGLLLVVLKFSHLLIYIMLVFTAVQILKQLFSVISESSYKPWIRSQLGLHKHVEFLQIHACSCILKCHKFVIDMCYHCIYNSYNKYLLSCSRILSIKVLTHSDDLTVMVWASSGDSTSIVYICNEVHGINM